MKKNIFLALAASLMIAGCHDDSAKGTEPVCGNGQVDGEEECDGEQFLASPKSHCQAGYGFGTILHCKVDTCTIDLERSCVKKCGNGHLDEGEDCDGELFVDIPKSQCSADKEFGKKLHCNDSTCTIDLEQSCVKKCGNGHLDEGEECDGEQFLRNPGSQCSSGYEFKDVLTCNADNCKIDLEQSCIRICGNGKLDEGEECDGAEQTWSFVPNPKSSCPDKYEFGQTKVCDADKCVIELEQSCLPKCGNGKIDTGEECDGEEFSPRTTASCADGYEFKETRVCTEACTINLEKSCTPKCGNGELDFGEVCDGSKFSNKTCSVAGQTIKDSYGFACTNNCQTIDDSKACAPGSCGDNNLDDGEACDGQRFREEAKICPDGMKPKAAPVWNCDMNCTVNSLQACETICGDDKVVGVEECDGTTFAAGSKLCPRNLTEVANRDLFRCKDDCSVDISYACLNPNDKQPTLVITGFEAELESAEDTSVKHLYFEIGNLGVKTPLSDCNLVGIKLADERTIDTNFVFSYPLSNAGETLDNSIADASNVITVCYQPTAGWIESKTDQHFKDLKDSCDVYISETQSALNLTVADGKLKTANDLWGIGVMCGTAMHDMIKLDAMGSGIYYPNKWDVGGARLCCSSKVSCRNQQTSGFQATGDTVYTSNYDGRNYPHQISVLDKQEYKNADCGRIDNFN